MRELGPDPRRALAPRGACAGKSPRGHRGSHPSAPRRTATSPASAPWPSPRLRLSSQPFDIELANQAYDLARSEDSPGLCPSPCRIAEATFELGALGLEALAGRWTELAARWSTKREMKVSRRRLLALGHVRRRARRRAHFDGELAPLARTLPSHPAAPRRPPTSPLTNSCTRVGAAGRPGSSLGPGPAPFARAASPTPTTTPPPTHNASSRR